MSAALPPLTGHPPFLVYPQFGHSRRISSLDSPIRVGPDLCFPAEAFSASFRWELRVAEGRRSPQIIHPGPQSAILPPFSPVRATRRMIRISLLSPLCLPLLLAYPPVGLTLRALHSAGATIGATECANLVLDLMECHAMT